MEEEGFIVMNETMSPKQRKSLYDPSSHPSLKKDLINRQGAYNESEPVK